MNTSFLKNKNILITGITGFIGMHLAKKLSSMGANVFGTSRTKSTQNIIKTDILVYQNIDTLFKSKQINICFHLAAESLVESGQKDPYNTFRVNTDSTLNILEAARKNIIEKVIITSTAHVYGNNTLPYFEEYTPKPSRPYETSKACTDLIAQSYADSFNLPVLIPRFVNIYGPGDLNFNRIVPKTMQSIFNNSSPVMWGLGTIRDYLFIDDAINALLSLAVSDVSKMEGNRIFNFGTGDRVSVEELMGKIIRLAQKKVTIQKIHCKRLDEISTQYVSWDKARMILGWEPKHTLTKGLRITHEWYQNYFMKTMHI